MEMNLKYPCAKCPFRTDCLKGWLGEERAEEIAESLRNDASFPCHETTTFDYEGESGRTGEESACAGSVILLEKIERPNQWMRCMERLGMYDRTKMKMDSPVFETFEEFIEHHAGES